MHIRRVRAIAFGALRGAEIDLAPGLTVVTGPNESGKSTWHAAVYAAFCGMRRARGGLQRADREFTERHRPWDGDDWEVAGEVALPDGRVVELRHDLAGRVDCRAIDLDTGADVTAAIVHDGAPDGSRWLGLDRRAFHALACVRQAEILAVTGDVDALREHLQRAAATAGADETAAAALAALAEFRRERVGSERATTRPLARARQRARDAELAHAEALRRHEAWLSDAAGVECLEALAVEARWRLHAAEARQARADIERLSARVGRVRALVARHPSAPSDEGDDEPLLRQVATAVRDWRQRPVAIVLEGDSADDIERRLAVLPAVPEGDTEPDSAVIAAAGGLDEAVRRVELHTETRPTGGISAGVAGDLTETELIDLARELDVPVPAVDPALRHELDTARAELDALPARDRRPVPVWGAVAAAVGGVAAGVVGGVAGQPALAGAGFVLAVVAVVAAVVLARWTSGADPEVRSRAEVRVRDAGTRLAVAEQTESAARLRREVAVSRATERGLPAEAGGLRRLADELRRAEAAERDRRTWQARDEQLRSDRAVAAGRLASELTARQVQVAPDTHPRALLAAVEAYTEACRQRAVAAGAAAQRPALEQALVARRRLEADAAEASRRGHAAAESLLHAAAAAGLVGAAEALESVGEADLDELADRLEQWEQQRRAGLEARSAARREWAELQGLLDGDTLESLEATLEGRRRQAAELAEGLDERARSDAGVIEPVGGAGPARFDAADPDALVRLRREAADAERRAVAARAEHERDGQQLPSVALAEEELAATRAELDRVEALDRVLECTQHLLEAAQDRVHRDIAPVLGRKVQDRLARITGGRYTQVTVDPQDLSVNVRDPEGHWRAAGRLSHGTAEQVYLLLRVAMAEILTGESARCPLLLDDVTVQSDPHRTRAVLDVLHDVSAEHQVVLFTQEDDVLAWAEEHLGARDGLVHLGPSGRWPRAGAAGPRTDRLTA